MSSSAAAAAEDDDRDGFLDGGGARLLSAAEIVFVFFLSETTAARDGDDFDADDDDGDVVAESDAGLLFSSFAATAGGQVAVSAAAIAIVADGAVGVDAIRSLNHFGNPLFLLAMSLNDAPGRAFFDADDKNSDPSFIDCSTCLKCRSALLGSTGPVVVDPRRRMPPLAMKSPLRNLIHSAL